MLSLARAALTASAIGTKVIFAGGFSSSGASDVVDIYDTATGLWSVSTLSEKRESLASASIGSKVFFAGGYNGRHSDVVDIYDDSIGTWSTAKLSSPRTSLVAIASDSIVFFAGGSGSGGSGFSKVVDLFHPKTNQWSTDTLSIARDQLTAAFSENKVFFAGGIVNINGGYSNVVDIFNTICTKPSVIITGDQQICAGETTTLTATGARFYEWSHSPSLSATSGSSVNAKTTISTNFMVTGKIFPGCFKSATISVSVTPLPDFIVDDNKTICVGKSVDLHVFGDSNEYSWSPSIGLSAVVGKLVTAAPTTTSTYQVTATGLNNCTLTKSVTVNIKPLPVVAISDGSLCKGSSLILTATGAVEYSWTPSAGLTATTGNNIEAAPLQTTDYTVEGVDVNGCSNKKQFTLIVKPVPAQPSIEATSLNDDQEMLLVSSTSSGNKWFRNGKAILGANNQLLLVKNEGEYTLQITENGCSSIMSEPFAMIVTSINEAVQESRHWLYPNPTSGTIHLALDDFADDETALIDIIDMMGRVINTTVVTKQTSQLSVANLAKGNYLLRISQSKFCKTQRFVKE